MAHRFTAPGLTTLGLRGLLLLSVAAVAGCAQFEKLANVGKPPQVTPISDPTRAPAYTPVSLPMPEPREPQPGANSLWRPGARDFLKDQRASDIGDIVTVQVKMTDSATLNNETNTTGTKSESANPFSLFGLENKLTKVLPSGANPASLYSFGSNSAMDGKGTLSRGETVTINMAAVVTQRLPNGNLVIAGTQELRVNAELRQLSVKGIIRPSDIASGNTISSDQIAEARIIYGGQGTMSDIQQPKWGQQIFDILNPF
jgi:flagellar L-ring protein precursor FlgH